MAMDQQRFVEVKSGQSWSSGSVSFPKDGHRVCLTRVSLVDPASAAGRGVVVARVKSDTWYTNIPIAHLSAASSGWDLHPDLVLDGEFFLYVNLLEDGDSATVGVRFDFYVLPPPAPETIHQQLSRRPWSVDLESGFTHRTFMKGGDRVCLTRVSLVDPARVSRQGVVSACVHTVTGRDSSLAPLSAERPSVQLSPVVVLDKEVYFYLNGIGCRPATGEVVVRFEGYVLSLETTEEELEDDAGEEVEVEEDYEYEEPPGFESDYDDEGSQEEEEEEVEESDGELDGQEDTASGAGDDVMHRTIFFLEEQFVGGPEPQFASIRSTAGFMRVAAAKSQEDGDDKILVIYRYTRFSTASDGALVARRRTKEHQLRFTMPPTGDTARSLPWAGASLAYLVYPGGHLREELQELWSNLIAAVSVPPRAAHVVVLFDVGILRRADCTPDSMERLRATLKCTLAQQWTGCHAGMELHLPEPVRCGSHDDGEPEADDMNGGERPAKRRKVVAAGDDCSICLQPLQGDDLAAWPGCGKPHVFHGRCLELVLRENDMCPICRRLLYIEPKTMDAKDKESGASVVVEDCGMCQTVSSPD